MALIKLGGLVTQISGKIGGQTLGTSASGSYIKNSGTPRKSITIDQKGKMSTMGTTAQSWRALTQAQRDVFNSASLDYPYLNRVGDTKFYSGYAIYGQLKNNAKNGSFSGIPVPLPKINFVALSTVTFVDSEGDLELNATGGTVGITYRFFMTRIMSPGVSNGYKNQFYIDKDATHVGTTVNINIANNYYAKWGALPNTGKFFWHIDAVHPSTGQSFKAINSGFHFYTP